MTALASIRCVVFDFGFTLSSDLYFKEVPSGYPQWWEVFERPKVVETMKRGCMNLNFNPSVWAFACAQRARGRKTALVTANMDVFTEVVIPSHKLDAVFDVIVNTADYGELHKELLWPIAFERLGDGIGYHNSLLIEDGEHEPRLFRERGGQAYQYEDDARFEAWLRGVEGRRFECVNTRRI